MKCYPEVLQVIRVAKEQFLGTLVPNANRIAELEAPCGCMDKIAERFDAEFVDCEVDEDTGAVVLSTEIPDAIFRHSDGTLEWLFGLADTSRAIRFTRKKGEVMKLTAIFGGIWMEA